MRIAWLLLSLSACDGTAEVEVSRSPGGAAKLEAQLLTTRLTVDGALSRDGSDWIVRAHVSRVLENGIALARDGPDGALVKINSHAFVLRWPDGEGAALVSGDPRLVELDFKATARAPPQFGARLIFGLRLIADGVDAPIVRDGDSFRVGGDELPPDLLTHVGADPLVLVRTLADGTTTVVQASVAATLERLALAEGDPRSVFVADGLR